MTEFNQITQQDPSEDLKDFDIIGKEVFNNFLL